MVKNMSESETTKTDIVKMIEKLEDLKKQATVERSHFYVNGVATEAIGLLYNLKRPLV